MKAGKADKTQGLSGGVKHAYRNVYEHTARVKGKNTHKETSPG